jgi:hypothetical protein
VTAPQGPSYTYETAPPPEMTYEEYLALVAATAAAAVASTWVIALPYLAPALTQAKWIEFIRQIYPIVEDSRRQVSDIARRFYDSERNKYVDSIEIPISEFFDEINFPDAPTIEAFERLDINLAPYDPAWFEEAMDAVVLDFKKPNRDEKDLVKLLGVVQKEIENGTRRTGLYAVKDDPEAIGWARVEGNENIGSCAWCAMLISRGPVYKTAETAGVIRGMMTEWHPNCDCKVVPVFKRGSKDWPGYEQYRKLEKLWADVTKGYKTGKTAGPGAVTDALNAFRRHLNDEPFISDASRRSA